MYEPISRILHFLLLTIFIGAVGSSVYYINADSGVTAAPVFVPTAAPSPRPTIAPVPEPGWTLLQPGLEKRVYEIYNPQNQHVESLHVWRLDQNSFRLDVAYEERPKSLESWQQQTNASIVLNGGYYSIDNDRYFPDGLTIVNGVATGKSFRGHGGMLAIQDHGAELRWLESQPYQPSEHIQAALQSFPVLVRPGGQLGYGPERESGARARRTVIAQDKQGRLLFMVSPLGHFTLHELSAYLAGSEMNLDIAVNLDGGGSTGILVANPRELIAPSRPIPFVILVYPR